MRFTFILLTIPQEEVFIDNTTRRSVIIFGADMNSYVHIDNKEKDILILGDGPTQGLDDNILTQKLFILLMHNQIQNFV